jgi:hypothetical protein
MVSTDACFLSSLYISGGSTLGLMVSMHNLDLDL